MELEGSIFNVTFILALSHRSFLLFPMLEMIKKEKPTPWRPVSASGTLNYNKYLKSDVSLSLCFCPVDAFMVKKNSICCLGDLSPIFCYLYLLVVFVFWVFIKKKKKNTFKCFFCPDSFSAVHIPFSAHHWFYPGAFTLHIKRKIVKLRSQCKNISPIFPCKYIA